ncbi:MAG: PqqD family protein [Candidatus Aminicenantes bacterium]|nr:PqqD family protein [Candidatus Aminicenantes bacterium]
MIRYDHREGIISEIKYDFWKKNQRNKIKNAFEINYNSLKMHPLWIDKKERKNFLPMQIEKDIPSAAIPPNAFLQKVPEVKLFVNSSQTEAVLMKTDSTYYLTNKTSLAIWEMCDGRHSKKDMRNHLKRLFPEMKSSTLAKDIHRFLEELYKNHFIKCSA